MDTILSVREVTERLRHLVEQRFPYLWVRGEVTNLSRPSSGHLYFSLKEGDSLLGCVWFRGQQRAQERFDPLTGEVWEDGPRPSLAQRLENGREVVCAGRLSVYGPRGAYQLVVELAQEAGQGLWYAAFEELKRTLAAEGLFDQSRKRPLPVNPARVALITAPTGAAVRDFIRVSADRGLGASLRLYPSPVQGDDAPPRIVAALEEANRQQWAEVIVLIRGGGSIQDLWAFNDERVARAVFASRLPVLTGVGHEIDHSIADFVADRAAATPSHAAQLLWSERRVFAQRVDDAESALKLSMAHAMDRQTALLARREHTLALLAPSARLHRQEERLADSSRRLKAAIYLSLHHQESLCTTFAAALLAGLRLPGGPAFWQQRRARLEQTTLRLGRAGDALLTRLEHEEEALALRLRGLDPLAPLQRGYALVRLAAAPERDRPDAGGRLVRSTADVRPGTAIVVEMRDGALAADVTGVASADPEPDESSCSRKAGPMQAASPPSGSRPERQQTSPKPAHGPAPRD